jgi:cytochrome c-type biogenesis protein CcmH
MNRRWGVALISLWLFILLPLQGHTAEGSTEPSDHRVYVARERILEVAKELHPPGCTDSMTADYCMLYSAHDLREEIRDMLAQGMDKDQVIDDLVQKYEDRILASPPVRGFHWLAWLLPGTAIAAGGVFIGFLVMVRVRKSANSSHITSTSEASTLPSEKQEQIQEELKRWL